MANSKENRAYVFDIIVLFALQRRYDQQFDVEKHGDWWESSPEFNMHSRRWYSLLAWMEKNWNITDFNIRDSHYRPLYRLVETVSLALQIDGSAYQKCFRNRSYSDHDEKTIKSAFPVENAKREKIPHLLNLFAEEAGIYPHFEMTEKSLIKLTLGGDPFFIQCSTVVIKWIEKPYELYSCVTCFGLIPPAKRSPHYCSNRCRLIAHRYSGSGMTAEELNEQLVEQKVRSKKWSEFL